MDNHQEFDDTMNFTASEFALGRQRCRKWVSLITQQLRLRHVYQIYAYNIQEDRKAHFYFTLHNTPMSSPFYTSEKVTGKNPKWNELLFGNSTETNISSVVIRVWKRTKKGDDILLTWGVNLSGLVYLGNKIADLQPKCFKANTVIFFMQGVYFTSQDYLRNDLDKPLPFQKNLNLIETSHNEQILYRRVAVQAPKGEVTSSYTLEKLRRLQELQRQIKNKKIDVQHVKEEIKNATERQSRRDVRDSSSYSNNIRFSSQLLTMNSLNKMLHEKPTKAERESMLKVNKKIEICRFRLRLLHQERDAKSANLRRLKQLQAKLIDENEEKNSNLMSLYHILSKESQQWEDYRHSLDRRKEFFSVVREQLRLRQGELLKELLFIYPIDKLPNENKYTMLGIHLPDSELLLDYQDQGVSVVLGYIAHVLIMCSIFLQVPLRHPMKHFGSRSMIYNQVYPEIPDKDREFPLYTKGRDRAHFSYAVFLLNKNISQLTWYVRRKVTVDLKETLKHLRGLLLGDEVSGQLKHFRSVLLKDEVSEHRNSFGYASQQDNQLRPLTADASTNTLTADSAVSLDKLVSPTLSSISSCNLNDPLIDRIHEEIRRDRRRLESCSTTSPKKKLTIFKSTQKQTKKEKTSKSSCEVLAVPEAYLNKQISKDLFQKCASGGYRFGEKTGSPNRNVISIRQGIEEFQANLDTNSVRSDSIEEGTDPLNPSTDFESLVTKSIDINREQIQAQNSNTRISRSVDSSIDDEAGCLYKSCELGSDPMINANKIVSDASGVREVRQHRLLEQWLTGDTSMISSSELVFPEECLRMSLQDSPLTERTDRLLSTNQSFNLVKHRPIE